MDTATAPQTPPSDLITRIGAIDLLRAMTMVLMIFVNDLWTLKGIPEWLEHVGRGVDGMGLADTVFPAFLFITGMSLPFAIDARRAKGDTNLQLIGHVILRAIALLIMGVFLVNGETLNTDATGLSGAAWDVLSCGSFILIWNAWPRSWPAWTSWALKAVGAAILLTLAIIYRGEEDGHIVRFAPQWWGILGLIGWSYLAAGLVTVLAKGRLSILITAWVAFALLSMAWAAGMVPDLLHHIPEAIIGGTLAGLSMSGVVIGRLFQIYQPKGDNRKLTLILLGIAAGLLLCAQFTRPLWGLAKLGATPAWLFLCSAITIIAFVALYWISDVAGKASWFSLIKPAGTDTLLTYLMPYFIYAALGHLYFNLPEVVTTGGIGLVKTFLFALFCVVIAGLVRRLGIRLKL